MIWIMMMMIGTSGPKSVVATDADVVGPNEEYK